MDSSDYLHALRKSWIIIVVLALVGLLAGFGIAHGQRDVYKATNSVFVSSAQGATSDALLQGSTFTLAQVQSYANLATTPAVLTPVIDDLGLNTTPSALAHSITASVPLNTVIIDITVSSSSASQASTIANAVGESLRTVAGDLAGQAKDGTGAVQMSIVTPATTPQGPAGPNRRLTYIVGLVIGLLVGLIVAVARFGLDTRLRSAAQAEELTDVAVLATLRRQPSAGRAGVALRDDSTGARAEDVRKLRATLQFISPVGAARSLTVVSALDEDRAAFVLDLALAEAERSTRVLVIDADLRHGGLAARAGVQPAVGLIDVLAGTAKLAASVQPVAPGVDLLAAGDLPSNPTLALAGERLTALMAEAVAAYDLVLVDTAELLPYSDALAVVGLTDGALLVAAENHTTRRRLAAAMATLRSVGAPVLGLVVTDVAAKSSEAPRAAAPAPTPAPAPADTAEPSPTETVEAPAAEGDDAAVTTPAARSTAPRKR